MPQLHLMREIKCNSTFDRELKRLLRKHHNLEQEICTTIQKFVNDGETGSRIPGLSGLPVFKTRTKLNNTGKRGGLRLIIYCDCQSVIPLFIYSKSDIGNIPIKEIRDALKNLGIKPPSDPE